MRGQGPRMDGGSPTATALTSALPRARSARARLSVCCMTRGPGARVAALLDTLRSAADEIVVAVDDRADPSVPRDLGAVADRVILYPYAEPVDRPLPWLFDQCRGDWVLALDDDEIPSLALIEALPGLCAAEDVTHYLLPRRWLFPDSSTYLDEAPWRPDYQLRLVRADRRFLRFSDEFHRPITTAGPGRFLEFPLWHADTILRSFEQRLEKARGYEVTRPGMRVGARALNFAFYLPDARGDRALVPVSPAEQAHIDAVLEAEPPAGPELAEADVVTREQIDARWPATEPDLQSGCLELLERPRVLIAGEQRTLDVRVHNTGEAVWQWGWDCVPEVRLGSRWYDAEGAEVLASQLRSAFPAELAPGRSDLVPVHVLAPGVPGRYRVEIDLIHEHVRWFGVGVSCAVLVRPRRLVAAIGDEAAIRGVARLLETVPELELVALRRSPAEAPAGYAEAVDGRSYLFDAAPRLKPAFSAVLAWRSLRLVLAALAVRRGREPRLPRGGDEFLGVLRACELIVVAGPDAPAYRRERWHVALTVRIAALLGAAVAVGANPSELLPRIARD